ncbi:MAG: type II toxin-antitoxin system VapC family toxin [Gammaproteobacteria bacterium]|nr:type II toxin-antitoxin system VapC family toxin [Gammaproteobacteria bacterium]
MAIKHQRTVYDCIYLALAIHEGICFVTADRKLSNALVDTDIADTIVFVEKIS